MLKRGQIYKTYCIMASEIERGEERGERDREREERGERDREREERGELYMYKKRQIYKYKTYLYKNRPNIQIKIV